MSLKKSQKIGKIITRRQARKIIDKSNNDYWLNNQKTSSKYKHLQQNSKKKKLVEFNAK